MRLYPSLLLSVGALVAFSDSVLAAQGPGLPSQTWPAGTYLASMNDHGRAAVWHRGWLYVPGLDQAPMRATVWDISNPTSPRLAGSKDGGSNVHDYWKVGDLFNRDYSMPELNGTPGTAWLDLNQLPNIVGYTGAAPKSGLNIAEGANEWINYPYNSAIQRHDFNQLAGLNLGGRVLIGSLLFATPVNSETGIACFDTSDPDNPRLLDVLNPSSPLIRQYTTSKQVWRNHFLFVGGDSPNPNGGDTLSVVGVDFNDPTDLRISYQIPYEDNAGYPSRYMDFQDEFAFGGRFTRGFKWNMVTNRRESEWLPPAGGGFADFYWLPIGHLVVGTGDGGKIWIYAHQSTRDTKAPTVGWHWPRANAVNQHVKSRVGLVINETLDDTTLNSQTFIVRPVGGSGVSGLILASDGDVINFSPDQPLQSDTTYEVFLPANGIKDAAGNGIGEFSFRFSTGPSINGGPTGPGGGNQGTPNLVVTDISWSPSAPTPGQAVTFSAAVQNSGSGASPAGTVIGVGFTVDGTSIGWGLDDSSGLAAGTTRTIVCNGTGPWTATAGDHAVEAFADDVNRILESDENDNKRSENFAIGAGGSIGTGSGLAAQYFNTIDLAGNAVLSRTEAIDFNWGNSSPGAGVNADNFSVRWTGEIEAPSTGSYIFQTESDDGIRLSVNGQQVINNWTDHGPTVDNSAALNLTGGQKYSATLEFYEKGGGALARLRWVAPGSGGAAAIPASRLYTSGSSTPGGGSSLVNGSIYEVEPQNATGMRLDVSAVSDSDGAQVHIWADLNSNNQRWKLEAVGSHWELIPQHATSRRLDVNAAGTANGTKIQIWFDNNSNAQRWKIESAGNGTYEISPLNASNGRLDVSAAGTANGTLVQLWEDNNTAAQRWKLIEQ